jgi:hypothetical protein
MLTYASGNRSLPETHRSLRRTFPLLTPIKDLRRSSEVNTHCWEATGTKPEFRLSGPFPKGWVRISFTASSETPRQFKLCADTSEGSAQPQCFALGYVSDSEEHHSVTVPLGFHVSALRLETGDGLSRFVIRELELTRVPEIGSW